MIFNSYAECEKDIITFKDHVVSVSLYLTDMSEFSEVNEVYKKFFGLKPPTRVCIEIPKTKSQQKIMV